MMKLSKEKIRAHLEKREAMRQREKAGMLCPLGPSCTSPPLQGPVELQDGGGSKPVGSLVNLDGPPGPTILSASERLKR